MQAASVPCDLCGHGDFESIGEQSRDGDPLATRICTKCGLVSHANVPSEMELQEYYSETYRLDYNREARPSPRRVMRAWVNGERIQRQVGPLLPAGSRIIEIGAGIGCTVKVFEQAGFQSEGIDPGGEFLKFSRSNLNANVRVCDLYELPDCHSYDAVLLVHVIEHFRSPRTAFAKIAGLLKPGGMLYVECPNLQAPFARRDRLFHVAHIHNLVPASLSMLAESCGLKLHKRFGDEQDPNLQMLFQHSGDYRLQIDEENYKRTVADLHRSDFLPYHLRWRYLTERIQKLYCYAVEHLVSKRFVGRLIAECQVDATPEHTKQIPVPERRRTG